MLASRTSCRRADAQVLFKLDKGGTGEEVCMADLPDNRGLSFVGFTPQMFLEVCTLRLRTGKTKGP